MSHFNNPSHFNTSSAPKSPRKISPILVGGLLLALIGGIGNLTGNAHKPQTNQPPMTSQYSDDRSSENGYAPQGGNDPAPAYQSPGELAPAATGGDATDNGYAAREKAQDQSAQAFDGYIRDTDTVRDTENGQVYTNVPNDQADSAIQSGTATEVPTAELPTSGDSGAASTPDTPASDAPAAE